MLLWPEPPIRARPTPAVTAPALVGGESWPASATAALRGTALSGGGGAALTGAFSVGQVPATCLLLPSLTSGRTSKLAER